MLTYATMGAAFAFAAAVQPGPFQAYLVSRALSHGWRRTLPAALAPLLSDGPIILLALLVLSHVPAAFEPALRAAGGAFLLYLAWRACLSWRDYRHADADPGAGRQTLLGAVFVNLLNPNPYLSWSLVLGPILLEGWRRSPAHAVALLAGFYVTMVVALGAIIVAAGAARQLGPRAGRALVGASAVALAAFGAWLLAQAAGGILAR